MYQVGFALHVPCLAQNEVNHFWLILYAILDRVRSVPLMAYFYMAVSKVSHIWFRTILAHFCVGLWPMGRVGMGMCVGMGMGMGMGYGYVWVWPGYGSSLSVVVVVVGRVLSLILTWALLL